MFLNEFAESLSPVDMTNSQEFKSLLESAADLGISHNPEVRYVSRNTVVRGMRFHFLEWGQPDAPPVLLLHGGNQSAHSWDLVSLHLSGNFHVFALDQRGHGDSEWSREVDYSVEAKVADARAFIEDQGLGQMIVIGHSMGGAVSMRLTASYPELVRRLVLVDVGPELSPKGVEVVHNFVVRNVEFDDLEVFIENVSRYDRFRTREHITRTVKYNMLQRVDGKYVSKVDHRRVPAADPAPFGVQDLAELTTPILLVRGGESDVLEAPAAEQFVAALRDARLITVPKVGHNVHGGNTPGFLEAVVPFLSGTD
jgi:pimeloyl-ACP methyl ester carboxylesterase